MDAVRLKPVIAKCGCLAAASCSVFFFTTAIASAQTPSDSAPAKIPASTSSSSPTHDNNPTVSAGGFSLQTANGEIKEDALKQMLAGRTLYLRKGYQDNNLEFDEKGNLTGHSRQGSFTLSQIQINKVKISKHKLELEGDRYALHFLGASTYEDPTKATDRVKITPKKKTVRISFEREQVEKPKKDKEKGKQKQHEKKAGKESEKTPSATETASAPQPSQPRAVSSPEQASRIDATKTTSPAQASQLLVTALDKVFSPGIDDRMIAAMPDFWKLYYQAAAAKSDIKATDPGVLQQSAVDQKAKLISILDPPSNEFAQDNGIAGIALYHAIVGSDGKVAEVVAGRPIGFGLDENAEQSIRKASFQPALKDGKPVPVALDLVVSFRIYSKRTSASDTLPSAKSEDAPILPGPYTAQELARTQAANSSQPQQPAPAAQTGDDAQPVQASAQNSTPVPTPQ